MKSVRAKQVLMKVAHFEKPHLEDLFDGLLVHCSFLGGRREG